jgi:2-oxoacid dehydrogenase-like protein with E3 subunit-binding domain
MTAQNSQKKRNQDPSQRTSDRQSGAQATQTPQSVQNDEQHPSANNLPSHHTAPEQEYSDYVLDYDEDDAALNAKTPDVLLDAPVVKLNNLDFELNDLRAKVSLFAKVLDLVELSVGIDAFLGRVKLNIESIEVQALLKVRLDNVTRILDRVLTTVDRNPQIVHELVSGVSSAVEDVGESTGQLVGEGAKDALSDIGAGAGSAVEDVGEGAGEAVEDVGEGAGSAVEDVGQGAGEAVEEVGSGAGQAVGEVGEGAGQAAQEVAQGASEAVDEVGQGARQAAGQAGQVAQGATDQAGQSTQGAPGEVQEDEVKVTPSAERLAQRLGVALSTVEGTGVGGRITVRDVRSAAQEG